MTRFLLDTGIASDYINRRHGVYERARAEVAQGNALGIGLPVLAELVAGIEHSASRDRNMKSLKVALAPCVIGYAEIATRLAAHPGAIDTTNPYCMWISEYASSAYQQVAAAAATHLDRLAVRYATPAREAELVAIFKEATRLETVFWEMSWRASREHSAQ